MPTLKLLGFSGEIPKILPRMLPETHAQAAFNSRLDDGGLTPIRKARQEHAFPGTAPLSYKSIYRHDDEWLGWAGVVNAAPGPVATDRLYFTGDGVPKMRADGTDYELKVPYPSTALTATPDGTGSGDIYARLYVYTWVTDFGEESMPAPASNALSWQSGETVTLSGFEAIPTGRNITKQRIYRSQSGLSAGAGLFLIAERTATTSDFTDDIDPEDFQELLPSNDWHQPPDDLEGLIPLPNGMMAAFTGKELCFCEPWRPHAWPEAYRLTTNWDIMGLGAFGNTIVVATKGHPYVVQGTHPSNMIMDKSEENLPCINKRSVQDLGYAVAYASHDGLVEISPNGARLATRQTMSRDDWLTLLPTTFVTGQYRGRYLASYSYTDTNDLTQEGTIIVDLTGEQPFIIRASVRANAFWYDLKGSDLFYLKDGVVYEYDARGQVNEVQSWRSKRFMVPRPTNFGAILIEAEDGLTAEEVKAIEDLAAEIETENAAKVVAGTVNGALGAAALNVYEVNGSALQVPPSISQFAAVAVYADDKLVAVINDVNKMKRLPAGFLARQWEIEASGTQQIQQITLAGTGAELMNV